ncbi:MAG: peptidoglycan-associated lipoprotein Pal [Stenotrophobium sp.]
MFKKYLITLVAVVALAGCASKGAENSSATPAPVSSSSTNGAGQNGAGSATALAAEQAAELARALEKNKVYFPFDSTEINADGTAVIETYAKYLLANPAVKVRLEGNTDERGTRAYNMGLGERRSNAVKSVLLSRGVSEGQMSVISYGEERPAAQGHDEAAWALNRRVEIVRQ